MKTKANAQVTLREAYAELSKALQTLDSLYRLEEGPLEGLETAIRRARLAREQVASVYRRLEPT